MIKECLAFIFDIEELRDGQEVKLTIRDLSPGPRKYDARIAKVRLHRSSIPGADRIWFRSWTGVLHEQPWYAEIVEELGEVEHGLPHSPITMPPARKAGVT